MAGGRGPQAARQPRRRCWPAAGGAVRRGSPGDEVMGRSPVDGARRRGAPARRRRLGHGGGMTGAGRRRLGPAGPRWAWRAAAVGRREKAGDEQVAARDWARDEADMSGREGGRVRRREEEEARVGPRKWTGCTYL